MPEHVVVQAGLALPDQPRQRDGGVHVRQGVVGRGMADAVGGGQFLQPEAGVAILPQWPLDTLGSQGIGGTQQVDQIPAGIAVLPLAGVGLMEIAVKGMAGDLIIETQ